MRFTCFSFIVQGELSNILGKVKDVISENEVLTEQAKLGIIRSDTSESGSNDFDFRSVSKERREKIPLSGPNIVFESRISELEAQLAQADIDVKKLTQENNQHKQKLANNIGDTGGTDVYKRQIDILQRLIFFLNFIFHFLLHIYYVLRNHLLCYKRKVVTQKFHRVLTAMLLMKSDT